MCMWVFVCVCVCVRMCVSARMRVYACVQAHISKPETQMNKCQ